MSQTPPKWMLGSTIARSRLAIVLLALTVVVLASKLLEDTFIERLRYDCHSLFADRLRPATLVFHLSDQVHQKQSLLTRYLTQPPERRASAVATTRHQLQQHDQRIDQLLEEFHGTYLVGNEAQYLRELRGALLRYREVEDKLLAEPQAIAPAASSEALRSAWTTVRDELLALSQLQEEVGQQLDRDSEASASGVSLLLYLQIAVAFVLGLIAAALASTLGAPRRPSPPDPNLH